MNKSSLMITDNSSAALDFAYLKKPIIYYQTDNCEPFSDDYNIGFGVVVKSKETLEKEIRKSINANCEMDETYKINVDGYFRYNDGNNCKRVYDILKNL